MALKELTRLTEEFGGYAREMELEEVERRVGTPKRIHDAYLKWQMARTCVVRASKELAALIVAEERARAEMVQAIQLGEND